MDFGEGDYCSDPTWSEGALLILQQQLEHGSRSARAQIAVTLVETSASSSSVPTRVQQRKWTQIDLPFKIASEHGTLQIWGNFQATVTWWAGTVQDTFSTNTTVGDIVAIIWSVLYPSLPAFDDDGRLAVIGNVSVECSSRPVSFPFP